MQILGSFTLWHTWGNLDISLAHVRNLDANQRGYFELFFIMKKVSNLHTNFYGYSKLIFIMA